MSPSYPSTFQHQQQQQQLHHNNNTSTPLKQQQMSVDGGGGGVAVSSCSVSRPNQSTHTPHLAHMPETGSLFDDLTNLDLVQQQLQNNRQQQQQQQQQHAMRYPYVPNPSQSSTNDYYNRSQPHKAQQQHQQQQQYPNPGDYNCYNNSSTNRLRSDYPMYDQMQAASPGYGMSGPDAAMHASFDYPGAPRGGSQINSSSRGYPNYPTTFMDNRNTHNSGQSSRSTLPTGGAGGPHSMGGFNYNFNEATNSSLSPPQSFLPPAGGAAPYASWTQM